MYSLEVHGIRIEIRGAPSRGVAENAVTREGGPYFEDRPLLVELSIDPAAERFGTIRDDFPELLELAVPWQSILP